ncbi:MAG: hypothetical protein ACXW2T_08940, partial [Allosphingosinicella sp.]
LPAIGPAQAPGPPVSGQAEPAPSVSTLFPVTDSASIAGQWDVVRFEGYEPRRLSGTVRAAFADFSEDGVALRIECNYSGRAGVVREGRFSTSGRNDRAQTAMSCGPERNARESRFFTFFESGPVIERRGSDELHLRAGNSELILQRPATRRLAFLPTADRLQGRWRLLEVTRYLPGGGHSGIGLSEVPGRIVIAGDRISYNRCPRYGLGFILGADGTVQKTSGATPPPVPTGCPELAEPAPGSQLPARWDLLRLLHFTPVVERSGDDALLISTETLGLLVTKAPCQSVEQSDDHRTSRLVDCASPE